MPIKSLAKITLQRISLQDKGTQVRWDQTAAQSSIIFFPIIFIGINDREMMKFSV